MIRVSSASRARNQTSLSASAAASSLNRSKAIPAAESSALWQSMQYFRRTGCTWSPNEFRGVSSAWVLKPLENAIRIAMLAATEEWNRFIGEILDVWMHDFESS